jgi:hypothetical protein
MFANLHTLQYSGAGKNKPLPTLLVTVTGAVDRGACIAGLSQYPGEVGRVWVKYIDSLCWCVWYVHINAATTRVQAVDIALAQADACIIHGVLDRM